MRWLIKHQKDDGDLRVTHGNSGMYAHGQATIVLCEAFAMTGDEELRVPAQKAIDFIVRRSTTTAAGDIRPRPRASRRYERSRLATHGVAKRPGREPHGARIDTSRGPTPISIACSTEAARYTATRPQRPRRRS